MYWWLRAVVAAVEHTSAVAVVLVVFVRLRLNR
jgi:hypothetical protein